MWMAQDEWHGQSVDHLVLTAHADTATHNSLFIVFLNFVIWPGLRNLKLYIRILQLKPVLT